MCYLLLNIKWETQEQKKINNSTFEIELIFSSSDYILDIMKSIISKSILDINKQFWMKFWRNQTVKRVFLRW